MDLIMTSVALVWLCPESVPYPGFLQVDSLALMSHAGLAESVMGRYPARARCQNVA